MIKDLRKSSRMILHAEILREGFFMTPSASELSPGSSNRGTGEFQLSFYE
jgi:hypothetical protein